MLPHSPLSTKSLKLQPPCNLFWLLLVEWFLNFECSGPALSRRRKVTASETTRHTVRLALYRLGASSLIQVHALLLGIPISCQFKLPCLNTKRLAAKHRETSASSASSPLDMCSFGFIAPFLDPSPSFSACRMLHMMIKAHSN